jgi:hypothetical protein
MKQLFNSNLYLGPKSDLILTDNQSWYYVHACKSSFIERYGNGPYDANIRTIMIEDNHLYLNFEDLPNITEFDKDNHGIDNLNTLMDYIDKHIQDHKVYIHCDYGQSRSPAIAMLYLAKRTDFLPNDFEQAKIKFAIEYPDYFSETGISEYVGVNWDKF